MSACWRLPRRAPAAIASRPASRESPDDFLARCRGAFAQHFRHGAEQHFAERVVVVVGGPAQHAECRLVPERRRVDRLRDGFQPARAAIRSSRPARRPRRWPAAGRTARARVLRARDGCARGGKVIEALPHRRVEDDLQDRRGADKVFFLSVSCVNVDGRGKEGPAHHSDTADAALSPESASGARGETMEKSGHAAVHGGLCMVALLLAWPVVAAESTEGHSVPPDREFLEFLGETSGVSPELVSFMESPDARRAIKDASRETPEKTDPVDAAEPQLTGSERFIAVGAERWQSMNDTDRAAARARFETWRQLPPDERATSRALEAVSRAHARATGGRAPGLPGIPRARRPNGAMP